MSIVVTEAEAFCAADALHPVVKIVRRGAETYDVHPLIGDVKMLGEPILFDDKGRSVGGNFATYDDACAAATDFCAGLDKGDALAEVQKAGELADLRAENEKLRQRVAELGG